ncbi:MAG: RagB/SusD family nutrient uptake outer membrane protein [Salinivirgaceae bacterium]|jgi:hypothetical protein|nr:RagB/SusD family nutrient uptake outer membrane protein [Salinivirgaceae bacterium]
MKKYNILLMSLLLFLLVGCNDDFLDKAPLNVISSEQVFNDEQFVEAYLYQIYNYMPCGYGRRSLDDPSDEKTPGVNTLGYGNAYILDCCTDILCNKSPWVESSLTIVPGLFNSSANDLNNWNQKYEAIRYCNDFLAGTENSELDPVFITRVRAEVRFVRAFQYFDLVRRFGGVPLIDGLQSLDDIEALMVPRNTADEIYDFIDYEYAEIADDLPSASELGTEDLGRATKEACWALNGRAMLFAERWTRSAELSKMVMDANTYTLSSDYNLLFQSRGGDPEVIFEVLFNGAEKGHGFDRLSFPYSFRADWGSQIIPTQDLVDSYETINGLSIDEDPAYDETNPYANRDSRLAATVLYQGNTFKGTVMDYSISSDPDVVAHGPDAPLGEVNNTTTGYNMNKFIDQALDNGPGWGKSQTSWKEIRLAEVLLNYAEAQNEAAAGPDASVYTAINAVRTRAGQPDLPTGLSKEEMFERIVQERKVELVGEGHRYWDIRRWHIGVEVLNEKNTYGMFVYKDAATGELTYERTMVPITKRPAFLYLEHFDLMPIPQDEMDKNSNLVQNPGY